MSSDKRGLDDIVEVVSERLGVSQAVVREAIKVILEFARKRMTGTRFERTLAEIPGVSALLGEMPGAASSRGESLPGFRDTVGDAAKVLAGLRSAGLQGSQIGPLFQAFCGASSRDRGPRDRGGDSQTGANVEGLCNIATGRTRFHRRSEKTKDQPIPAKNLLSLCRYEY